MIEIDVIKLKNELQQIKSLIDEYEEIELNLFNQLNCSMIDWQDSRSLKFESQIALDKKESALYLNSLKSRKALFEYIYENYRSLGKRIAVNLNNKTSVLRSIDECYNEVSRLLRELDSVDKSFDRTIANIIDVIRSRIVSSRNKLASIKLSVKKIYKRIEEIEETVEYKIKNMEIIKINGFDFTIS